MTLLSPKRVFTVTPNDYNRLMEDPLPSSLRRRRSVPSPPFLPCLTWKSFCPTSKVILVFSLVVEGVVYYQNCKQNLNGLTEREHWLRFLVSENLHSSWSFRLVFVKQIVKETLRGYRAVERTSWGVCDVLRIEEYFIGDLPSTRKILCEGYDPTLGRDLGLNERLYHITKSCLRIGLSTLCPPKLLPSSPPPTSEGTKSETLNWVF